MERGRRPPWRNAGTRTQLTTFRASIVCMTGDDSNGCWFSHLPDLTRRFCFFPCYRLAVSDCAPQTSRVSSNLHSSSSMAVSRVPSPPPPEVNTPVAENWCYTQVRFVVGGSLSSVALCARLAIDSPAPKFIQPVVRATEMNRHTGI